jgi:hypothetical protein
MPNWAGMAQKTHKIALEPFSGLTKVFTHPGQRKALISELLRFAGPLVGRWAGWPGKRLENALATFWATFGACAW